MWQNKYLIISTFFKLVFWGVCAHCQDRHERSKSLFYFIFYPHLDFHTKKKGL